MRMLAVVLVVTGASAAHADAVSVRDDCPLGSTSAWDHRRPAYCAPAACDDACPAGACRSVGLCLLEVRWPVDPSAAPERIAVGSCSEPGPCAPSIDPARLGVVDSGDAFCALEEHCAPATPALAPAPPRVPVATSPGCSGCTAAPRHPPALFGLLALLLLRPRRRSRAARR